MDFSTHGRKRAPSPNTNRFSPVDNQDNQPDVPKKPKRQGTEGRTFWIRVVLVVFLLCLVALIVALLLVIGINKRVNESRYVDANRFQTVQVTTPAANTPKYYYGKITGVGEDYIVLSGASVLTSSPSDKKLSIVPLVCLAPNPSNNVVLDKRQIVLWSNLLSTSPVTQALKQLAQNDSSCPASEKTADQTKQPAESQDTQTTSPTKNDADSQTTPSQNSGSATGSASTSPASKPTSSSDTTATNPVP